VRKEFDPGPKVRVENSMLPSLQYFPYEYLRFEYLKTVPAIILGFMRLIERYVIGFRLI
jgi:hypothetical protein